MVNDQEYLAQQDIGCFFDSGRGRARPRQQTNNLLGGFARRNEKTGGKGQKQGGKGKKGKGKNSQKKLTKVGGRAGVHPGSKKKFCTAFNSKKGCARKGRCPKDLEHACNYIVDDNGWVCGRTDHGSDSHTKVC